jgi:hypothetical protein
MTSLLGIEELVMSVVIPVVISIVSIVISVIPVVSHEDFRRTLEEVLQDRKELLTTLSKA